MRIYTRSGDDGSTALANGRRVSKAALRVEAYGEVDELNSAVGVLIAMLAPEPAPGELMRVQDALFHVGALLADPAGKHHPPPDLLHAAWLERWIDQMEADLAPLRNFIVPGGSRGAAFAHLARSVCRRAERKAVALLEAGETSIEVVLPLLNRLSDALFVCARWLNLRAGAPDVVWRPRG